MARANRKEGERVGAGQNTETGLRAGRYPPQPVSVLETAPNPSPSFLWAQAIFEPNLFPYKYPNISQT